MANRGIVVDEDGYYVGALRWGETDPRPNFGDTGLRLLTSSEALALERPGGRWLNNEWVYPTERRWIVTQRRDKPDIGQLSGSRLVWPERLPVLANGQFWVAIEPPAKRTARPVWRFSTGEWVQPRMVAILQADGICQSIARVIDPEDAPVPPGGRVLENPENLTDVDELGKERPLQAGDRVSFPSGTPTVEVVPPRYARVPVRFLRQALQERNLLQPFAQFLRDKGFDIEDFEGLKTVSLNNQILREFVQDQGFTMRQAYNALQRDAEERQGQEQVRRRELARENRRGSEVG